MKSGGVPEQPELSGQHHIEPAGPGGRRPEAAESADELSLLAGGAAALCGAAFLFVLWNEKLEYSYRDYAELWSDPLSRASMLRWLGTSLLACGGGALVGLFVRPAAQIVFYSVVPVVAGVAAASSGRLDPISLAFTGLPLMPAALCGAFLVAAFRIHQIRRRDAIVPRQD